MAGTVQRILSRRKLDFGFGANDATATEIQLATQIDISRFREVVLYVRTHALSTLGTWNTAPSLVIYADGSTEEDPTAGAAQTQVSAAFLTALAGGTVPLTLTAAPSFQVIAVPPSPGSLLTIAIKMAPSTAGSTIYTAWLSIDMSGKE